MQFPKLTPLQSRFAATFAATLFLIVLYLVFSNPSFAYAAEFSPAIHDLQGLCLLDGQPTHDLETSSATIRQETGRRQESRRALPPGILALGNNEVKLSNINIGQVQYWVLPKEVVQGPKSPVTPGLPPSNPAESAPAGEVLSNNELKKRGAVEALGKRSTIVYVSLNTCLQPSRNQTHNSANSTTLPPPLEVYISTSIQAPGPGRNAGSQSSYAANGGFMSADVSADEDVYIAVAAPNTTEFTGIYNYEIATSIDDYFHSVNDEDPFLYFVDSDLNSALLETNNVTQASQNSTNYKEWMNVTPPWTIFVSNQNYTVTSGLERSYCALNLQAQIRSGNDAIQVGMTSRGLGNKPKEDIYITGLNRSSTYVGILGMSGNSTAAGSGVVGGGGKIWRPMQFFTKEGMFITFYKSARINFAY
jgi:calcium channel MID1